MGYVELTVTDLRLFPSGVFVSIYYPSSLLMQVKKYFAVTDLIVFSHFVQLFHSNQLFCSRFVKLFCSRLVHFFPRNYTLICLIFVEWDLMFFLTILLSPIVFLLWGYTISINSNFFNVIEMCSAMFWIWFMTFGLFITTRNMFSYVLVYGMYVFYLIFLKIRNLFYLFDGCLLCCVRVFKG